MISITSQNRGTKYMKRKRQAFTLAEVLITLGIIGVIAALTMPILIKSYQNKQKSVALKRVYSTLQQALIMSQQEHGDTNIWERFPYHMNGSLDWSNEYIFKYIKKVTACEGGNSELGCPSEADKICRPDGSCHSTNLKAAMYVLSSGETIYIYGGGNPDANFKTSYIHVLVDINGIKSPNQYGKDVFAFTISLEDSVSFDAFGGNLSSRTGLLTRCKQDPEKCAALVRYDDWEFKRDYPW